MNKVTNGEGLSVAFTVCFYLCVRIGKLVGVHQMKVTKPKYLENKDLQDRCCDMFYEKG